MSERGFEYTSTEQLKYEIELRGQALVDAERFGHLAPKGVTAAGWAQSNGYTVAPYDAKTIVFKKPGHNGAPE